MLKYGLKYNIVTTVPLHECVYFYTELPSKTRLSDELLLLNYRSKSPFPETALFTYLYQKVHLFLWFSPLKKYTSLFVVPEGFWVYRILLKQGNGLYAVSQEDGTCLVADIDDHVLRTQYLLPSMEKCGELERRFRKKIIHISSETYNEEYASLLKDPKALLLLRHFANFNLSKQR
ncbi:MAG: hypothetical protein L3J47_11940, partial [Sulfurovum sp.]|nr:hypothetical protein [Sulfurovum sp.]